MSTPAAAVEIPSAVNLAATILCVLVLTESSRRLARSRPLVFAAMIFLGVGWALLVPYWFYERSKGFETLPALASYIHLWVGFLLAAEGAERVRLKSGAPIIARVPAVRRPGPVPPPTPAPDGLKLGLFRLAPVLLFVIVHPSSEPWIGKNILDYRAMGCIGYATSGLAFWSIGWGISKMYGNRVGRNVAWIAIPYMVAETIFLCGYLRGQIGEYKPPDELGWCFAILKLAFTIQFMFLVNWETPTERRGFRGVIRDLVD